MFSLWEHPRFQRTTFEALSATKGCSLQCSELCNYQVWVEGSAFRASRQLAKPRPCTFYFAPSQPKSRGQTSQNCYRVRFPTQLCFCTSTYWAQRPQLNTTYLYPTIASSKPAPGRLYNVAPISSRRISLFSGTRLLLSQTCLVSACLCRFYE